MRYCGVVTDRNWFVKNGFEGALDRCYELNRPYQQRRIYSDEVPMANVGDFKYRNSPNGLNASEWNDYFDYWTTGEIN